MPKEKTMLEKLREGVEKVEEVRNKIPIFADRKPKIYQL